MLFHAQRAEQAIRSLDPFSPPQPLDKMWELNTDAFTLPSATANQDINNAQQRTKKAHIYRTLGVWFCVGSKNGMTLAAFTRPIEQTPANNLHYRRHQTVTQQTCARPVSLLNAVKIVDLMSSDVQKRNPAPRDDAWKDKA